MKESIRQIVSGHQRVLDTRKKLEKMFSMIAECHVTVGGSYMLKYWCEAFSEREVSDYDFILYALPENMQKIKSFLHSLNTFTGVLGKPKYYDNMSFNLGYLNGKKINVIMKEEKVCFCSNFESLEDIIKIKRQWCETAIKQGKKPRYKDVEDIATYEEWVSENDLAF